MSSTTQEDPPRQSDLDESCISAGLACNAFVHWIVHLVGYAIGGCCLEVKKARDKKHAERVRAVLEAQKARDNR
jgi:hypothetical protein